MERSLPDWNKIQNSKNNNLVFLIENTAITFNCLVRGPAVISPAGKRTECENNSYFPFWRTLIHGPKFPLPTAFSRIDG